MSAEISTTNVIFTDSLCKSGYPNLSPDIDAFLVWNGRLLHIFTAKVARRFEPDYRDVPGHYKVILNVFGFDPPSGKGAVNPVGDDASALIHPKAGFSLGFLKTTPGNGLVLHNHNSSETFMPLGGTCRFTWESGPAHTEFVDLGPYDTISFPPACHGV